MPGCWLRNRSELRVLEKVPLCNSETETNHSNVAAPGLLQLSRDVLPFSSQEDTGCSLSPSLGVSIVGSSEPPLSLPLETDFSVLVRDAHHGWTLAKAFGPRPAPTLETSHPFWEPGSYNLSPLLSPVPLSLIIFSKPSLFFWP